VGVNLKSSPLPRRSAPTRDAEGTVWPAPLRASRETKTPNPYPAHPTGAQIFNLPPSPGQDVKPSNFTPPPGLDDVLCKILSP